jgi:hypothetical protein
LPSLIIDRSLATVKTLTAPDGYSFGGHGLVLDGGDFLLPCHLNHASSREDEGLLQVYSKRGNLISQHGSYGVHPHEVHRVPGTNLLAVSHYGLLNTQYSGNPQLQFNVLEPKLSIFDINNLEPVDHIFSPLKDAILTHFDIDSSGNAYIVSNQYWLNSTRNPANFQEYPQAFGDKNFKLSKDEANGNIAIPTPLIKIHIPSRSVETIFTHSSSQRRSQSVATNQLTQKTYATYPYSNTIIVSHPQSGSKVLFAKDLGLNQVRGVSEVPNTTLVIFSDVYENLAVLDSANEKKTDFFTGDFKKGAHVYVF